MDDAGRRPFWTYAHVPAGSPVDQTEPVIATVERFAPGFRDVVVASRSVPAACIASTWKGMRRLCVTAPMASTG